MFVFDQTIATSRATAEEFVGVTKVGSFPVDSILPAYSPLPQYRLHLIIDQNVVPKATVPDYVEQVVGCAI